MQALLAAQRAGTPVAVAVSQSSPLVPFQVPRAIVVLGWFWVLDAWTELVSLDTPSEVVWKFRFEWCSSGQGSTWWQPKTTKEAHLRSLPPPLSVEPQAASEDDRATLRGRLEPRPKPEEDYSLPSAECKACGRWSEVIYAGWSPCLNEDCSHFCQTYGDHEFDLGLVSGSNVNEVEMGDFNRHASRSSPEGQDILSTDNASVSTVNGGGVKGDLWQAWACKQCRMANERRHWLGLICESCSHVEVPHRQVYTAAALRGEPTCSGPRTDNGHPKWTSGAVYSQATFTNGVKAVTHTADAELGTGARVSQLLNHSGASEIVDDVLRGLQVQGEEEIKFRRHMLSATSPFVADLALCPFFTFVAGPQPPYIPQLPCGTAVPWAKSPKVVKDALDYVNERAGRVCKDTKE